MIVCSRPCWAALFAIPWGDLPVPACKGFRGSRGSPAGCLNSARVQRLKLDKSIELAVARTKDASILKCHVGRHRSVQRLRLNVSLTFREDAIDVFPFDVASMSLASDNAFTPPPQAWIAERVKNLNAVLAGQPRPRRPDQRASCFRRAAKHVEVDGSEPHADLICNRNDLLTIGRERVGVLQRGC